MSGVGQNFILSILPIILGLILFLLLMLFDPNGKKYVITKSATIVIKVNPLATRSSIRLSKNYLYDQLILEGMFVENVELLQKVAFSKFGMLSINNLTRLLNNRSPK